MRTVDVRRLAAAVLCAGLLGPAAPAAAAPAGAQDILTQLADIPGMTVTEGVGEAGYRSFQLVYRQPVDHGDPSRGTFGQRATLLHRDVARPMVLHTTGYWLGGSKRSEPAQLIEGNQLSTEQRFFRDSTPAPADWSALTIAQAAADHHRFVTALRPLYQAKWLSTGASKGGMTSVYHRRFYPGDVDATVAYVAPNDVDNDEDSAYTRFFATVGDTDCRARISALQREVLGSRRAALTARVAAAAAAAGQTFDRTVGTADGSLEVATVDALYAFWQYEPAATCDKVPPATATDDEIYGWIDKVAGFAGYTDQGSAQFVPYYYQASAQLGYPTFDLPALAGLLRHPELAHPRAFVPRSIPLPAFDTAAMRDVDSWVRDQGERMMFVNGQFDPWSAEPFRVGAGRDSFVYEVRGGNHGATVGALSPADRAAAQATLRRWAGVGKVAVRRIPGLDGWTPLTDQPRRARAGLG
ncbi:tripeptidyl aminopeptidase [Pilimelia terevasa]|uniref:Tripeptidyl aminopeptidase n=1 Tax=Pilimelia terevasa TaxID=53372 RepID=A0A8J3FK59_9ACTN|nr:S28 family serine protease [Pilimelia terevasa]GGK37026.1 tripeptidyl aminopeptidase [Pilimelia terevasa]